ncbi:sentrin-specific protease 8-like [Leptopilina boulardi]|uniref:sentrin-specific protease 8-like n=1 Tax=Leptopilina boulardi TaxID=63433 RepID=UPI0021F64DCF|nr:sentrin-specific protease 8-like [Leptopilina boulardi]
MTDIDKIILSYHDCLLRKSDVDLLIEPNWINDALIGFYLEYLGKTLKLPNFAKILYSSPELTQLLKMTDSSEVSFFLDPLNALQKNFIFFPLNNCERRNSSGGSHWSLLVYSKIECSYFHFDSLSKSNEIIARNFIRNLDKYLIIGDKNGTFIEVNSPQQENCYDCGIYVMCITDILTEYVTKHSKVKGCDLENVKRLVSEKRNNLTELINSLKT